MIQFFTGVLLLAILYLALRLFSRGDPKALARLFRQLLGVFAFVVAIGACPFQALIVPRNKLGSRQT